MKKNLSIQALRAIAFLLVFLGHANMIPRGYASFGVSIFIVLSGFLMAMSYSEKKCEIGFSSQIKFSKAHIKKLYPLHIVCMVGMLLFCDFSMINILKCALNIFLVQAWFPSIAISQSLNGVAWYLSTCTFLYFMFPILWKKIKLIKIRKSIFVFFLVYVTMIALRVATVNITVLDETFSDWFYYVCPFYRLGDFLIGVIVGNICLKIPHCNFGKSIYTFMEAIAFSLLTIIGYLQTIVVKNMFFKIFFTSTLIDLPLSVLLVILFWENKGRICNFLNNRVLIVIGNYSGVLFLTHYVSLAWGRYLMNKFFDISSYYIIAIISIVFSFILGIIYLKIQQNYPNLRKLKIK